eukprot:gene24750-biopygen8965
MIPYDSVRFVRALPALGGAGVARAWRGHGLTPGARPHGGRRSRKKIKQSGRHTMQYQAPVDNAWKRSAAMARRTLSQRQAQACGCLPSVADDIRSRRGHALPCLASARCRQGLALPCQSDFAKKTKGGTAAGGHCTCSGGGQPVPTSGSIQVIPKGVPGGHRTCPRHAGATQAKKMAYSPRHARAMPAPRPCHCPVPPDGHPNWGDRIAVHPCPE